MIRRMAFIIIVIVSAAFGQVAFAAAGAKAESPLVLSDSMENPSDVPEGWTKGAAVPGVKYIWDKTTAFDGKASLCLEKNHRGEGETQ